MNLSDHSARLLRSWRQWRSQHDDAVRIAKWSAVAALGLFLVASTWLVVDLRRGLPTPDALSHLGDMDQATTVLDASGQPAFTIFREQRIEVPLERVSPHVVKAILSAEDQRFYEHRGFNPFRMGFALLTNIREGRAAQGASTITQQLARLSFLTPNKTMRRKLQELILATRIEQTYSKDEILGLYLNKVYFGDGLYGIEAASRGYFGKNASELSVGEAALLIGLVKSPSNYSPTVAMDKAVLRRNLVLDLMRKNRAIETEQWKSARAESVVLRDSLRAKDAGGLYFKEEVRQELVSRFGWEQVYQGGLRVFSTVNMKMQAAAEAAVAQGLTTIETRRASLAKGKKKLPQADVVAPPLQAALIALDPQTGYVHAMVGGRDFDESHFNRAVQAKRQPGSAFKPFVYAAALEAGYTPATLIRNLNEPIDTLQGAWTPDDGHSDADELSLRSALRTSSNRAAVRLLKDVGISKTVAYAKTMGIGDVPSVPSLALGSGDVTLQSLTAAYAAFANHGDVPKPILILRVEDRDGTVLYEAKPSLTHAISDQTAYLMTTMLADVINAGTGARARALGFRLPAAGKTGTTNEFRDAWFIGYTPKLVAGVWVGLDQPQTILRDGFAADIAVPMWTDFMKQATRDDKPTWISPPKGITSASVCRLSGKLATEGCQHVRVVNSTGGTESRSMVYSEYFTSGTEPTGYCDLHESRNFFESVVAILTPGDKPAAVRIDEPPAPPASAPVVVAGAPSDMPSEVATPVKKRGFWSRVFGRGKDRNESKDRNENTKPGQQ